MTRFIDELKFIKSIKEPHDCYFKDYNINYNDIYNILRVKFDHVGLIFSITMFNKKNNDNDNSFESYEEDKISNIIDLLIIQYK